LPKPPMGCYLGCFQSPMQQCARQPASQPESLIVWGYMATCPVTGQVLGL
jgi:hypothetical protein